MSSVEVYRVERYNMISEKIRGLNALLGGFLEYNAERGIPLSCEEIEAVSTVLSENLSRVEDEVESLYDFATEMETKATKIEHDKDSE